MSTTMTNSSKLKTMMTTTRMQHLTSLLQRTELPPSDFLPITPVITLITTPVIVKGIATSILTPTHTCIRTLINTAITTVTTMTTPTQQRIATRQLTLIPLPILTPMEIAIRTMPILIAAAKTLTEFLIRSEKLAIKEGSYKKYS